jgi:hypothetical protein
VPAAGKVCASEVVVLAGVPSPQFQERVIVSPVFGSLDAALEKLHTRPAHDGSLITALGAWLPVGSVIVTVCVVVPV